ISALILLDLSFCKLTEATITSFSNLSLEFLDLSDNNLMNLILPNKSKPKRSMLNNDISKRNKLPEDTKGILNTILYSIIGFAAVLCILLLAVLVKVSMMNILHVNGRY
ncbi:hypothetical protein L9F63_025209, partial [Diploptera punctata]